MNEASLIFHRTPLEGVIRVESRVRGDERGSFLRGFCAREFAGAGLPDAWPQHNFSVNKKAGTLRGLHYQQEETAEHKLVRCVGGRAWDVVADVRAESPTRGQCWAMELSGNGSEAVFIPAGCAHGFITLEEDTRLYYLMGNEYRPEMQQGIVWDDPALNIQWPMTPKLISEADRRLPRWKP